MHQILIKRTSIVTVFFRPILALIFLAHLLVTSHVRAQSYNYPGGIIDMEIAKESTRLPEIKYGIRDVTIIDQKNTWRILLGIDLKTIPGEYLIYVKRQSQDSSAYSEKFEVRQQDTRFIDAKTDRQTTAIYHDNFSDIAFYNTVQPELPLYYPAKGMWADYFGYINTTSAQTMVDARNYISLTTTELLTVTAPQNAIVSRIVENSSEDNENTKKNYTLFLDHGRGLYSIISGVTDITIETGNGVQAGAVLGKVYSASNNTSQPRTLIWQTVLNGAYVNPSIFIKL